MPKPEPDELLADAAASEPTAEFFVTARRRECVLDEDIRWYWNLTDLEQCVMDKFAEHTRMALYLEHLDRGETSEEAGRKVRKAHPIYGDPQDTRHAQGEARPLSIELRDRVDRLIEARSPNPSFRQEIQGASSFNAFFRAQSSRDVSTDKRSLEAESLGEDEEDVEEPWQGQVYLGMSYVLSADDQLVVTEVDPGSPAEEGDVQPGDLVEAVDRKRVRSIEEFDDRLAEKSPGSVVTLTVRRGSRRLPLSVTLGEARRARDD